mmetsp:Transcript_15673/g.28131  ORF Transcript_15673/g.28131 Transcript_15673/m.28131 type:complete len:104 (-) Transcript_15673:12-323(-)
MMHRRIAYLCVIVGLIAVVTAMPHSHVDAKKREGRRERELALVRQVCEEEGLCERKGKIPPDIPATPMFNGTHSDATDLLHLPNQDWYWDMEKSRQAIVNSMR